jgi:outer membrane protein assembly factor BamD
MGAFANYQSNKYDEAINALDRFIQLHPGHKDVAYAYYLRAISYYEQISDVGRDQNMTWLALQALENVVRRFPESRYSRDAILKLDLARDHLAGKHMEIGRFYLKKGEYLAAINRFRTVIKDYQTTTHVPEAMLRLVESYLALGVTEEAQATAAVLGYNYPGSAWYADSYVLLTGIDLRPEEYQDSWISRVWKSLI